MEHRGNSDGGSLHFAVRSHQLFDRPESAAAEFSGDGVGSGHVWIHHPHQTDRLPLLGQLMINASVVASKGAHPDHSHVDKVVRQLVNSPGNKRSSLRPLRLPLRTLRSRAFNRKGRKVYRKGRKGNSLRRLFQQSDLAGVIQLVLHDPAEQVVKVVIVLRFARNLFGKT